MKSYTENLDVIQMDSIVKESCFASANRFAFDKKVLNPKSMYWPSSSIVGDQDEVQKWENSTCASRDSILRVGYPINRVGLRGLAIGEVGKLPVLHRLVSDQADCWSCEYNLKGTVDKVFLLLVMTWRVWCHCSEAF